MAKRGADRLREYTTSPSGPSPPSADEETPRSGARYDCFGAWTSRSTGLLGYQGALPFPYGTSQCQPAASIAATRPAKRPRRDRRPPTDFLHQLTRNGAPLTIVTRLRRTSASVGPTPISERGRRSSDRYRVRRTALQGQAGSPRTRWPSTFPPVCLGAKRQRFLPRLPPLPRRRSHPGTPPRDCDDLPELVGHDNVGGGSSRASGRREQRLADEASPRSTFSRTTRRRRNSYGCHENTCRRSASSAASPVRSRSSQPADRRRPHGPADAARASTASPAAGHRGVPAHHPLAADHQHRDEPHADPRYRRLHVIVGDSNMNETTTLLRSP